MNTESVVEFLGNVPLLRRLPSSSLKIIAQVAVLKHYVPVLKYRGDYVVREGQDLDGVYFILEGEAQVLESAEEENCSAFLLQRFDYFGPGIHGNVHPADVVAVSELTCLLLLRDHCALFETKSIWDSDEQFETRSLVERILHLDHLDLNIFHAITLPNAPSFGKVYGGQLVGQALAAASKTVDFLKIVHNFHSCFLRVGDIDIPIIYEVHRISDGNKIATRRVDARQRGKIIYILFASFQGEKEGYVHQDSTMPIVPAPDSLLSREELHDRRLTDPRIPRDYRNKVAAAEEHRPSPIDIRLCEPNYITEQTKSPPRLRYWFKVKGNFSDDQVLHRCAVAFVSDWMFGGVTMNPHRRKDLTTSALSLDHSMWFHRPLRADDWLLFVMVSPTSSGSRGFTSGEMFNRKGELVVSLTQEALLKQAATVKPTFGSKL